MFDNESEITVDGKTLTPAQVATIRVAVTTFLVELDDPEYVKALGAVGPLYRDRAREVLRLLVAPRPVPPEVRVEIRAATERAREEIRRLDEALMDGADYKARFEAGLPASRAGALERARAALEHIEAAQRELCNASADLSAINGGAALQAAAMKLHDQVHRYWYRVNDAIRRSEDAPLGRDKFTLDGCAAPDGVVRDDEHPHRGCGNQIAGPRAHGLHRTIAR